MATQLIFTYPGLNRAFEQAIETIEGYREIEPAAFHLKLNEDTWSCMEVCQHLIQFNRMYLRQMEKAILKTEEKPKCNSTFTLRWIYKKLVSWIEPPVKLKIKTLSPMYPAKSGTSAENVIDKLIETNKQVLDLLRIAEDENWDLNEIKGRNPVIKLAKMTLTEFIVYMEAHQRRHFQQIENVLGVISGE